MRTEVRLFLKQHGAAEVRLADAIAAFFDDQLDRVARDLWFSVDDEHRRFMDVVRPHLVASMGIGAQTQLALGGSKAFVPEALRNFDLPDHVLEAIEGTRADLEAAPYWRDIQATTSKRVVDVLDETIGFGPRAAGKVIPRRWASRCSPASVPRRSPEPRPPGR